MSGGDALVVDQHLRIPRSELTIRATRASGPGGQHVNRSSTRVELLWNLEDSRAISAEVRARLRDKLASRLDSEGNVRVVGSEFRSQARNREAAESRLAQLVRRALVVRKRRKKTKPTRASVEQRLLEKKRRGAIKRLRRSTDD